MNGSGLIKANLWLMPALRLNWSLENVSVAAPPILQFCFELSNFHRAGNFRLTRCWEAIVSKKTSNVIFTYVDCGKNIWSVYHLAQTELSMRLCEFLKRLKSFRRESIWNGYENLLLREPRREQQLLWLKWSIIQIRWISKLSVIP